MIPMLHSLKKNYAGENNLEKCEMTIQNKSSLRS
jgi:hypothetical protein